MSSAEIAKIGCVIRRFLILWLDTCLSIFCDGSIKIDWKVLWIEEGNMLKSIKIGFSKSLDMAAKDLGHENWYELRTKIKYPYTKLNYLI